MFFLLKIAVASCHPLLFKDFDDMMYVRMSTWIEDLTNTISLTNY